MSGPWGRGSAHSIASRASGTIKARSMRAAMLSAHHQPKAQVSGTRLEYTSHAGVRLVPHLDRDLRVRLEIAHPIGPLAAT
jgi:hypothetical protein